MNFTKLKTAVAKQFETMSKGQLYRVDVSKDDLWDTYLASFPEGSNPVYRERTEHDCNCCKQFIRAVGDVVAIVNNELVSIWDVTVKGEPEYQAVVDGMAALVKSKSISNYFLHFEASAGSNKSFEDTVNGVKSWDHFFVTIPQKFVRKGADIASELGSMRSAYDVLNRGLKEITDEAIETVMELIQQNSLYRGEEHMFMVKSFRELKNKYKKAKNKELFVWASMVDAPASVQRTRNSVIGSLMVDLSADVELETAVRSFEAKVAPTNYKRPTSLVTKKMVDDAKKTIESLGLTSALERRYATLADITINNILYANRDARKVIDADVFDEIANSTKKSTKSFDKVEEVSIDKFIKDILPVAKSIELMLDNKHASKMVSLIAPVDPTAVKMFKWDNAFSWSYTGDVTDSIKERVKKAGGSVEGDLCCRLAWNNYDDLDFHMVEPDGYEIYFGNRGTVSRSGGRLDVDMNAGYGSTREPVENIFYSSTSKMKEGIYKLFVQNFNKRESVDVGFTVQIDMQGEVVEINHPKALADEKEVVVAEIKYSKAKGFEIVKSLPSSAMSRKVWGLDTMAFHKVNVMMMSPNHWDDKAVGNKHYFFMLENCVNEDTARGFYNEFLREDLAKHRKVLEIVGSKMKTAESVDQLSGVGFSSTAKGEVILRIGGTFNRVIKVVF